MVTEVVIAAVICEDEDASMALMRRNPNPNPNKPKVLTVCGMADTGRGYKIVGFTDSDQGF